MALAHSVLHLLGNILPPKDNPDIQPELLLHHEPRFKRIYRWHTLVGLLVMVAIPVALYGVSGWIESAWYVQRADALFALPPESGLLGLATGMMLSFGLSISLAAALVKGYIGADFMELYQYWYDRRPNHPVDSEALGRGMMWLFVPLALFVAVYFRYDYTIVTQDALYYGNVWRLSEKSVSLTDIQAAEMQIGKIAPIGDYVPGFRYRFRFNNGEAWESPFFDGSLDKNHLRFRPMIDYVLQQTGLALTEIETPAE